MIRFPFITVFTSVAAAMHYLPALANDSSLTAPATTLAQNDAAASSDLSDGEIRKVDKEAGKLTIKHGPLKNLGMPAMTMVFRVKDPAILDKLQAGDKVKFEAQNEGGAFTVTKIAPAK